MSKNRQQNQTTSQPSAPAQEVKQVAAIDPSAVTVQTANSTDVAAAQLYSQAAAELKVEKTPEVVVAPPSAPLEALVDEFELPLGASTAARITVQELKDYITKMSAKVRMAPEEGGKAQSLLYVILVQAINTPAAEFDTVFGLVMKLIRANLNGAFDAINVHRYTPHVTLPSAQAASMRYLVNALTALADPAPEVRKVAKRQINIEQALGDRRIKEEARQRVLAFFNYE